MAPFGLFEKPLQRTPLSLAVPLDGTERQIGLRQLERLSRRRPGIRTRYRRFKGPFLEYLTLEDLRRDAREWKDFLHAKKSSVDCYTVPGSVDALVERLEENIVYFLPNYMQVIAAVVMLMLGLFHGSLAFCFLAGCAYFRDKKNWHNAQHEQLQQALTVGLPIAAVWLILLTPIAAILSRGIFFGLLAVLSHGSLHRSPSELRYRQQNGMVRWVKRGRAAPEGVVPLFQDLWIKLVDAAVSLRGWIRWKLFDLREFLMWKKWALLHALNYRSLFRSRQRRYLSVG